jgi:membrane-bound serine protease (ClpP class)
MRKIYRWTCLSFVFWGLFSAGFSFVSSLSFSQTDSGLDSEAINAPKTSRVLVLDLKGTINPAGLDYLRSGIQKAEKEDFDLLVLKIDTPGGLLSTTRSIAQKFSESRVPIAVWVTPAGASATSAGALIGIASHQLFMAEGTNIGAAHPVQGQGQDMGDDLKEKAVNDTVAFATSMAQLRGRNTEVAEKIVRESLSLTASQALEKNLSNGIANDLAVVIRKTDGVEVELPQGPKKIQISDDYQVESIEMTIAQQFLHVMSNPNIAYILMALGGLGLYVEISNPGGLIPGLFGLICLILAFVSLQTLPINLGGIALFVFGLGMLVAEPFVPSFGILTIGGLIALVIGALFLVDTSQADLAVSWAVITGVSGGLALVVVYVGYKVAETFRTKGEGDPMGYENHLGKVTSIDPESALPESDSNNKGIRGKVKVDGEFWNFISEEPLGLGDEVIVTKVDGLTFHVKKRVES